jgi:sarcosine oxidase
VRTNADVIVVGLGAVGSAALYQLARRGVAALGIDRWAPPHPRGSSHGDSRITRLALGEGPQYVQFARRAHEIWRELEQQSGGSLLRQVGCLIYGSQAGDGRAHGVGDFLAQTIAVARQHGIAHEPLDAAELARRYPQFRWSGDERGCLEPSGGFVHPDACIATQLALARQHGAQQRTGERVRDWTPDGDGIAVRTERATYRAARLILAAGAWLPELMPALAAHARICRQVMYWFAPDGDPTQFRAGAMPVFVRLPDAATAMFYGFPVIDDAAGVKIAGEQFERADAPDAIDDTVAPAEAAAMHALAAPHLRITSECRRAVACKYTVTPDFQFVIDHAPQNHRVWFASACSGHGFKHSAAVGEALAEIAAANYTGFDLSPFRLARWAADQKE